MSDDESKKNGNGDAHRRARRITPVVTLPTPEETARRIGQLEDILRGSADDCRTLGPMALEGGFDARTRAFMINMADAFEDLSNIAAGTARALRRLARL